MVASRAWEGASDAYGAIISFCVQDIWSGFKNIGDILEASRTFAATFLKSRMVAFRAWEGARDAYGASISFCVQLFLMSEVPLCAPQGLDLVCTGVPRSQEIAPP